MSGFFCKYVLAIALFCNLMPQAVAGVPSPQPRSVLVITSDNTSFPYFFELHAAFKSALASGLKQPAVIYTESLDEGKFNGAEYRAGLQKWHRKKYRNIRPDAIVVVGREPLKYLIESGLWRDVPTCFVSVSHSTIAQMRLPPNMTGLTFSIRLADIVGLAKQILPKTRTMALVGNAPKREYHRPFLSPALATRSDQVEFIDLRGMRLEDVKQRISSLPEDTVIYHTTLSEDETGRIFDPRNILEAMLELSNRPTMIDVSTSIGFGTVGGLVLDPKKQGRMTALRIIRLLGGEPPSAMPVEHAPLQPMFDWRQLAKWHIDPQRLPADSEILYREPATWRRYRWQITGALIGFLSLSALVVALLFERRRRAVAVSESRKRLTEIAHMNRNATASIYSAAIAHELNQPLAAILSNAEAAELFLKQQPPAIREVEEILNDIRRDDQRASDLIQRMRELLKKSDTETKVIDFNDVVKDALNFILGEARLRDIVITIDLCQDRALVAVDRVQLQQVIINLILNSMDALVNVPAYARAIVIQTSIFESTMVKVVVTDTGTGFDAGIERVFESFFTTKSHGMGLGLSITASIIEAHGGFIRAENAHHGGAIVHFQLPLQKARRYV